MPFLSRIHTDKRVFVLAEGTTAIGKAEDTKFFTMSAHNLNENVTDLFNICERCIEQSNPYHPKLSLCGKFGII